MTTIEDEAANARGLKVHLRLVDVGGYVFRVVTLRPGTTARFSTNLYHHTWHILTDGKGAFVLARLLWGLAFQKQHGTIVLIDSDHLVPTPFDGDRPDQVVLARSDLVRKDADLLRALKHRIRRERRVQATVRWHTHGLPLAPQPDRWDENFERVSRVGGFLVYSATAASLRETARRVYAMRDCADMDYHYLGLARRYADGEVQVFRDFRDMVSAAKLARRSVQPGPFRNESERERVQSERVRRTDDLRAARRT